MKKYVLIQTAILLLLCALPCLSESILIFGNAKKPPKNYLQEGQPRGTIIAIMRYADERLPESFEYHLYPWERAYRNTLAEQGGLIGLSMTSDRLKILDYSEVMYYEELLLIVLKGNEFTFSTMDDLQGKRVGGLRAASYGDDFDQAKDKLFRFEKDASSRQRLLKLLHGRIDVAIIGPGKAALQAALGTDDKLIKSRDRFVILPVPLLRDPNYLGFAKGMQMKSFLARFNEIIREGYESGELQKIVDTIQ